MTTITVSTNVAAPIDQVLGTMTKCMRGDLEALRDVCERGEG